MNNPSTRFIENNFPMHEVSLSSRKEKSIRQGHLSTLSTWWARRPLSASRAMIFLSAIPAAEYLEKNAEVNKILDSLYPQIDSCEEAILKLTSELSKFENSNNDVLINSAKMIISLTNPNLTLLDSFSGGGSIPLESLRLGLETHASDLNPIATTALFLSLNLSTNINSDSLIKLQSDIKTIESEIDNLYKNEKDCLAYFYAKTVTCPCCEKTTPLFSNKWLSKKGTIRAFKINIFDNNISFSIFEPITEAEIEYANLGTVKSKSASCVYCNSAFPTSSIQKQGIENELGEICYAKCISNNKRKEYIALPIDNNRPKFIPCSDATDWMSNNFDLKLDKNGIRHLWAIQYGIDNVSKLFNETQMNSLISISHIIYKHRENINLTSKNNDEALFRYLSLIMILNKTAVYNNKHSWWQSNGAFPANIFVRQAISMIWNYVEIPQSSKGAGGWKSASKWILKVLEHLKNVEKSAHVTLSDAAKLTHKNESIDIIAIDPPYFDSITYAYLSDFFYPWMKALLVKDFPEWYHGESTPKSEELIVDRKHKLAPSPKDKSFFEKKLTESLTEANRVLKNNGILTIMYGHKGIDAWATLFNSISQSGFKVTASWPVNTERKVKFKHSKVDALETSCLLTLRKIERHTKPKITLKEFEQIALKLSEKQRLKLPHADSEADNIMSVFPIILSSFFNHDIIRDEGDNEEIKIKDIEHLLTLV